MPKGYSLNVEKVNLPDKYDLVKSLPAPVVAPKVELNGSRNWGQTDGFVKSTSSDNSNGPVSSSGTKNETTTGSSGTAEEIEAGNAALSSTDKNVVTNARDGVASIESTPDAAAPVENALSIAEAANDVVTGREAAHANAVSGLEAANGAKKTAQTNKDEKSEAVTNQKQDVQTKESNLKTAEAAVSAAKTKVSGAEASVSSAQSALYAAQSALPYSAPAVAAAQAALQTAQAQLAAAKAELAKAQAEEEVAKAQLNESKAKLSNDENALKEAETQLKEAEAKLEKANQEVAKTKEALTQAKANLSEKKAAYEAVKNDTKQVASEVRSKLDETLKKLESGEETSKASSGISKWQKASAIVEGVQKAGSSLLGLFTNSNQASTASSKRKMSAEESAQLDKTLASVGNFINNGGAQITHTGESVLDFNTRIQSGSNPFLKKTLDA